MALPLLYRLDDPYRKSTWCISLRQTCVFLIDSLQTLGYTLAGFRRMRIYERFTTLTLRVRTFSAQASWRKYRVHITSLTFKEVQEWQNQ